MIRWKWRDRYVKMDGDSVRSGSGLNPNGKYRMKKGYVMNSRFWTGVTLGVVALFSILFGICFAVDIQCEGHVDQQIMLESDDRDLGTIVVQSTSIEDIIKETKVGYIKRASEIKINATPSDIVVVMLGGSGGPDGDNPLGGSDMTNQGFKLIDLAGDSDCRIEGWVKIWVANDGNNVMIPLSSKDSGYGIVVIDGTKAKVNPSYLNNSGEIVTENGRVTGLNTAAKDGHLNPIKDMVIPLHVGGTGLTLAALMFDDPLRNLSVIEGNSDVPIYWVDGPRVDKGFGDGDSFGFMVMEGDEVTRMSGENGNDPGTDYSEITINFDGWLSRTKVTDEGLEHLKGLTQLQTLELWGCLNVTDVGLEHIKGLVKLKKLNLSGTQVTNAGLEHLKGLTQLQTLSLSHTKVTDAGLEHLKGLTQLQSLIFSGTQVTDAGKKKLQQALPNCKIQP